MASLLAPYRNAQALAVARQLDDKVIDLVSDRDLHPRRDLVFARADRPRAAAGTGGALKGDARGVTQGLRGKRLASALVAGQMALAMVLLAGAGVLVRSFVNIVSADTGIRDAEQVLVGRLRLPSDTYPSPATQVRISIGSTRSC